MLCEISSKLQCPDCSLYWVVGIVFCTYGKCLQPSERNRQLNKGTYDVLSFSRLRHLKESVPWSQIWTNICRSICTQSTRHAQESPEETVQCHLGQVVQRLSLPRFFVKSWMEWRNYSGIRQDRITENSYTATREERRRNENSWKLWSNAEGAHGPIDQRDVFEDAKEISERPYHEHTAISGFWNTPIPPLQQVRQRPNQQFEGHTKNIRLDLIHLYGHIMFPPQCIRPSSSSRWQPSNWWSTWNWDSWDS